MRQKPSATRVRDQANFGKGLYEFFRTGGKNNIASQGQTHDGASSDAINRADDRLGQLGDFTDERVVVFFDGLTQIWVIVFVLGCLLTQILTGTKTATIAGQ